MNRRLIPKHLRSFAFICGFNFRSVCFRLTLDECEDGQNFTQRRGGKVRVPQKKIEGILCEPLTLPLRLRV